MRAEEDVTRRLRDYVIGRIHIGQFHAGDQLPSYRELSAGWGVDHRAIARGYKALEEEGLVEVRGRSGVYLAPQEKIAGEILPETARWAAEEVLTEAWKRRIKVPELPEFIRRCTSSVKIRTACIESTEDHRHFLCTELKAWFGFEATPVSAADIHWVLGAGAGAAYGVLRDRLPGTDAGAGLLFGAAFWLAIDEGANYALRLTPGPTAFPWQTHARGLAGHLVFGMAAHATLKALDAVA